MRRPGRTIQAGATALACFLGTPRGEAQIASAAWPREPLVALNSVWLRDGSQVHGDVAVVYAGAGPFLAGAQAVVASGAGVHGSVTARAIGVAANARVTGQARGEEVRCEKGARCETAKAPPFPLAVTLPPMPRFIPGDGPLVLDGCTSRSLPPGEYGRVQVRPGGEGCSGVATLDGGTYEFAELEIGALARMECAAPCELRIEDRLQGGEGSYLGPSPVASLTAHEVQVFVGGLNGSTGELAEGPPAAALGSRSTLVARLFAPNGTLSLGEGARATGTFVARDILVGGGAEVTAQGPGTAEAEIEAERGPLLVREASEIQTVGGEVRAFTLDPGVVVGAGEVFERYATTLGLGPNDDMIETGSVRDPRGRTHRRFQQRHRGLPVFDAEYVVEEDAGRVVVAAGRVVAGLEVAVTPCLSAVEARQRAVAAVRTEAPWRPDALPTSTALPPEVPPKLGLASEASSMKPGSFRLVYRFRVVRPAGSVLIDVDAHTGAVVSRVDEIQGSGIASSGDTLHYGAKTFIADESGSAGQPQYTLLAPKGFVAADVETVFRAGPGQDLPFVRDKNDFSYWPASSLQAAKDSLAAQSQTPPLATAVGLHWAIQQALSYWMARGWLGADGTGQKAIKGVLAATADLACPGPFCTAFCACTVATTDPVELRFWPSGSAAGVSLGVVGHEFTHLVMSHAVGAAYGGESGALREGLADIFGYLLQDDPKNWCAYYVLGPLLYYKDDKGDGSCNGGTALCPGEQCDPSQVCSMRMSSWCKERDMGDPKASGNPDTYDGQNYKQPIAQCNQPDRPCHQDSTIVTHWFYVLVNGKQGVNDKNDVYQVQGIGREKAEALVVDAVLHRLGPSSDFAAARVATEQAAKALFPGDVDVEASVKNAWYAVGVGQPFHARSYSPSGLSGVDPWPATLTWSALPNESEWEVQVSASPSFQGGVKTKEPQQAFFKAGTLMLSGRINVLPETSYYWRVRAKVSSPAGGPSYLRGPGNAKGSIPWLPTSPKKQVRSGGSAGTLAQPPIIPAPPDAQWGAWGEIQELVTGPKIPVPSMLKSPRYPWNAPFGWKAVPGASEYRLTVSTSTAHTCGKQHLTPPTAHTVVDIVPHGGGGSVKHEVPLRSGRAYYWWLKVLGPEGIPGGCAVSGTPMKFQTETPVVEPLSPPDGGKVSPFAVTLEWKAVKGAIGYGLQLVKAKGKFGGAPEDVAGTQKVTSVGTAGKYRWRVRPRGPLSGDVGAFSGTRSFVADLELTRPSIVHPKDDEWLFYDAQTKTTFQWTPVAGAVKYRVTVFQRKADGSPGDLAISTDPSFWDCNEPAGTVCTQLTDVRTYEHGYCWQAKAVGPGGLEGADSDMEYYGIGAAIPQVVSPSYGATGVDYDQTLLTWQSDYPAGGFQVWYHKMGSTPCSKGSAESVTPVLPGQTTYGIPTPLAPSQAYCWGVDGVNPDGSVRTGQFSWFTTKAKPAACTAPDPGKFTWLSPPWSSLIPTPFVVRWRCQDPTVTEYKVELYATYYNGPGEVLCQPAPPPVSAASITSGNEAQFTLTAIDFQSCSNAELFKVVVYARGGATCNWTLVTGAGLLLH